MTLRSTIVFLGGFATVLAAGWVGFPNLLYKSVAQPLDFNHSVHQKKASMQCADCHSVRSDGTSAGIPATTNCSSCHAEPAGSTKNEKMLVVNWVKPGREIPWQVYSRQPVNVRFSHAVHVQLGKLACENCHGTHGASERLARYEENRISGYSRNIWGHNIGRFTNTPGDGMKMSDCEQCHEKKGVEAGCLGCHQ